MKTDFVEDLDGEGEGRGPLGNLLLQSLELRNTSYNLGLEVLELVGLLGKRILDLAGVANALIHESSDSLEVFLSESTGGSSGGANADSTGSEGRLVAGDGVLVAGHVDSLKNGLNASTIEVAIAKVKENHVRVGAIGNELVVESLKLGFKRLSVLDNLLLVKLELRSHGLLEGNRQSGDGVVVRPTLVTGEDTLSQSQQAVSRNSR